MHRLCLSGPPKIFSIWCQILSSLHNPYVTAYHAVDSEQAVAFERTSKTKSILLLSEISLPKAVKTKWQTWFHINKKHQIKERSNLKSLNKSDGQKLFTTSLHMSDTVQADYQPPADEWPKMWQYNDANYKLQIKCLCKNKLQSKYVNITDARAAHKNF